MTLRNILLATDLSARCDRALERAARLAREHSARLTVVHALQPVVSPGDSGALRRPVDPLEFARRKVRADMSGHDDIEVNVVVEQGDPAEVIPKMADQENCDLIVTGMARNEALGRFILGNTVDVVVRQTDVPVLVVKSRAFDAYMDIVVTTDFSEHSRFALERTLVMFPDKQITLFHAFDVSYETLLNDRVAARDMAYQQAMEKCREFIEATLVDTAAKARILPVCEYGYKDVLLNDLIRSGTADLVVLGTEGRSSLSVFLFGSTAQLLATELPVDVLLVRRPQN